MTYNDRHHDDRFEGVPIGGYTHLFENMLDHKGIEVRLGIDYFRDLVRLTPAPKVVYTGKIDQYFDYRHGGARVSLAAFKHEVHPGDFQGSPR